MKVLPLCHLSILEIKLVLELTTETLYLWCPSNLITFRKWQCVVSCCLASFLSMPLCCFVFSLAFRRWWGTLSKAFQNSRQIISTALLMSYSLWTSFSTLIRQECFFLKLYWVHISTLFPLKLLTSLSFFNILYISNIKWAESGVRPSWLRVFWCLMAGCCTVQHDGDRDFCFIIFIFYCHLGLRYACLTPTPDRKLFFLSKWHTHQKIKNFGQT